MKSAIEYIRDEARRMGFEKIARALDSAIAQLTDDSPS
jgi:hypothetical protein